MEPEEPHISFCLISLTRLQAHKHRRGMVLVQELMEKQISSRSGTYPLKSYQLATCSPDSGLIAPHWHVDARFRADFQLPRVWANLQKRDRELLNLIPTSVAFKQIFLFSFFFSFSLKTGFRCVAYATVEPPAVPLAQTPKYRNCRHVLHNAQMNHFTF